MNEALECLVTEVPGPRTAELAARLRAHESRNVTFIAADFPVFWESADGATVTDVDGNRYLDATAAFGVANAGHCNPRVADAVARQVRQLVHGMGDVHPSQIRVQLLERLAQILPMQPRQGLSCDDRLGGGRSGTQERDAPHRQKPLCGVSRRLSRPFVRRVGRRRNRALSRTVRRRARCPGDASGLSFGTYDERSGRHRRCTPRVLRARRSCGGHHRAHSRTRRRHRSAARLSASVARPMRRAAHRHDRRRDIHRFRANRSVVRGRTRGRRSRHPLHR